MTELLRISDITKVYSTGGETFHALDHVSISIQKGEFVAIMGPSGSGKSTLMHIIGCLDRPTSGMVVIEGRNVMDVSERELAGIRNTHIGFVFQQFNLLRKTPAIANVELPLIYANVAPAVRRQRAQLMLSEVGLSEKANNIPSQLSGGQQQRVAIARALVTNPSIILADEPTGNLDSKSGADILHVLLDLHKKGKTIVLVTHDAHIARFARRIVRIADGKITGDSTSKNNT